MRKLQESSLYIAIALYFLCYCSWGNPSSAFVRVFRAIQNARSPKISRPPDPLFIHRTPSEAPKTEKRTGVTPARKKRKKKKNRRKGSYGLRLLWSVHQRRRRLRCKGKGSQDPRYLTSVRPGPVPPPP
jgi:hypothetical protein